MSASQEFIHLKGIRQNNLKGFDLDLPLGKLIVVTGLSGAGKSSLVFETLHAEGQRRYVETFSPYTRQFLELLDRPATGLGGKHPAVDCHPAKQYSQNHSLDRGHHDRADRFL